MVKFKLFLVLILGVSSFAFSQKKTTKRAELEAEKKAFILKALELNEAETDLFWPVYQAYEQEVKDIRKSQRAIKKTLKNMETLSEEEVYNLTEKLLNLEKNEAVVQLNYLAKFSQVLGKGKAGKVFKAEYDFKKELFKKIKNGSLLPPPPPKN